MAKKSSKSSGFPFFGCFLIFTIIAFAGIFAGFYLLLNQNPFAREMDVNNVVQQMNPDVTQIPSTSAPITPDTNPNSQTFIDILNDLNAAREADGLGTISFNSLLNNAAAQQALYNASIYDPKHEDADGDLADVRVSAQGYEWMHVGENLLSNWSLDGHEVFTLWQNSPVHNENMMNPIYTEVGLAYMVTPIGQVYQAMVLARPS